MVEIKNAIISDAKIFVEDHGLLSAFVYLDYGCVGQGFGGYSLYNPNHISAKNYCGHFIWRTMEVVGVSSWNELKGKTVRVKASHERVHAIGHIIKDDWFDPSVDFKKMEVTND